ncbi:MAG: hypothetical protein AB1758_23600 [Candidatus Eremiobacterota bacterium]
MSTYIVSYEAMAYVNVPVEASSPEEALKLLLDGRAGKLREVSLDLVSPIWVTTNSGKLLRQTRVTTDNREAARALSEHAPEVLYRLIGPDPGIDVDEPILMEKGWFEAGTLNVVRRHTGRGLRRKDVRHVRHSLIQRFVRWLCRNSG